MRDAESGQMTSLVSGDEILFIFGLCHCPAADHDCCSRMFDLFFDLLGDGGVGVRGPLVPTRESWHLLAAPLPVSCEVHASMMQESLKVCCR